MLRILSISLVVVMILTMLAGCRHDTDELDITEFAFIAETISLPHDIGYIRDVAYFDGKLYFWSQVFNDETWESTVKLFSINTDGSNLAELPNFYLGERPSPDAQAHFHIMSFGIDHNGYIWIAIHGDFSRFDLPDDFDGEDYERWYYIQPLGSAMNIRKLDNTGAEILTIDRSVFAPDTGWFRVDGTKIDNSGNLYIASDNTVIVLDNNADLQFQIDSDGWISQLFPMPSGEVAIHTRVMGRNMLHIIDPVAEEWGESFELPQEAFSIFSSTEDYSLIFHDGLNLYGLNFDTGDSIRILNWLDSDVSPDGLDNIAIMADGRILSTNQIWQAMAHEPSFEINILTRVPYSDLPERTIITFATVWPDQSLSNHIIAFNRSNPIYRIQVIDYSEFNTDDDWRAGMVRLSADIIAGNIPDIINVSNLPFEQYATRGLFADLYPFIDADPELSRGDLLENVFRASEINGSLYQIFSSFRVSTMIGNSDVVGSDMGWTMDEFQSVLNANPQADMPIGGWLSRNRFLETAVMLNISEYVDWIAGEANFDTAEFAQLLELALKFPEQPDSDDWDLSWALRMEDYRLIAEGRQIIVQRELHSFGSTIVHSLMFGDDFVYKGFPSNTGTGHYMYVSPSLAITAQSQHQEGAWQFLRETLTADWQIANGHSFPTNRVAFDWKLEEDIRRYDEFLSFAWGDGMMADGRAPTQEEIDKVIALIDSTHIIVNLLTANPILDIVNEGAEDFFAGRNSAEETARIIQSRASRYISEQSIN